MKCPICKTDLLVVEREGIEVDWCLDCGGLWFDEGELELLGEKAGRSIAPQILGGPNNLSAKGRRRCPRCPKRMESLQLELGPGDQIIIDRCLQHGLWLDRGELGQLMRATQPSGGSETELVLEFLGELTAWSTPIGKPRPRSS